VGNDVQGVWRTPYFLFRRKRMAVRLYRLARSILLLLSAATSASGQDALFGTRWSDPQQLREAAGDPSLTIRYIDSRTLLVNAPENASEYLENIGLTVFFRDRSSAGERYYIAEHLHPALAARVPVLYWKAPDWALVRLSGAELEAIGGGREPVFLWPLPQQYEVGAWLRPAAKAAQPPAAAAAVSELIEQVDRDRLRVHVERLALLDPEQGSVSGNLRTRYARSPDTRESTDYIRGQLAEVLGEGAVQVLSFRHSPKDSLMFNVEGVLPGTDPDAGYYVICAHYDAIAVRTSGWDWENDPAPGADDNASGVALVLESARLLASQSLPWSVRFVAFSGEELGLWGSLDYAADAVERDDRIIGVLNFDMIGFNDLSQRLELVANTPSRWLADLMVETNARHGIGLRVDVLEDGSARLSDHAPFWARGFDGILGIENYLPTDGSTYGVLDGLYRINSQYHSVVDLPDSLNWDLVRQTTQLAVATLAQYALEDGPANLVVSPGDISTDPDDNLRVRVGNAGIRWIDMPYRVRVSQCQDDSTACVEVYNELQTEPLEPGGVHYVAVEWDRWGELLFHLEVDPGQEIQESNENDNQAFQSVRLVPQTEIKVWPNPYTREGLLRFSGVPLKARVEIFTVAGELLWQATEDDDGQRRLGARARDVVWRGISENGLQVSNGVYLYRIIDAAGAEVDHGKIAIVR